MAAPYQRPSTDHDARKLMVFPYDDEVVFQVTTPSRSYQSTLSKNDAVDLVTWLTKWLADT